MENGHEKMQKNFADRSDFEQITEVVKELLGKSEGAWINPPFYCDYGSHIEVGKNFYANYNCTIIDVAKVKIGENCFMAPNVAIYTAVHPIYPGTRNSMFEYGKEVTIGDNVWLGGKFGICIIVTIIKITAKIQNRANFNIGSPEHMRVGIKTA